MRDAVVVGSGPNGLAAAITLARAGRRVLVREAEETFGGGVRSAELTLPGFVHDVCSSIYPFVPGSPFFRPLPLADHGLEMVESPAALAHPFDDGTAVVLERSIDETAAQLGRRRGGLPAVARPGLRPTGKSSSRRLLGPLVSVPRHPVPLARFSLHALRSATALARHTFRTERAQALFAGCAAHSMAPLEKSPTASFGLVLLAFGHPFGWPFPRGGSQRIADALRPILRDLGGEVETAAPVDSLDDLDANASSATSFLASSSAIAGDRLPDRYRAGLPTSATGRAPSRSTSRSTGPSRGRRPNARRAGRAPRRHAGGGRRVGAGPLGGPSCRAAVRPARPAHPLRPAAAPEGKHTAWAYCHVPNGSAFDMTERIEAQIERFAPGFRDARHRSQRPASRRARAAQPQSRRWRPQRRRGDPHGAARPAGRVGLALQDAGRRALPLLRVDAARGRRPRDVRLLGRARCL